MTEMIKPLFKLVCVPSGLPKRFDGHSKVGSAKMKMFTHRKPVFRRIDQRLKFVSERMLGFSFNKEKEFLLSIGRKLQPL